MNGVSGGGVDGWVLRSAVTIAHSSEHGHTLATVLNTASHQGDILTVTLLQIIKDLQLLGLVAVLVVADVILLVTWVLTDPIQCLQILGVSMKVRAFP